MTFQIREIDNNNQQDLKTITNLHLVSLDFGPMAKLGELFLRKVCYTLLIRDGVMKAALYEVDGTPTGFIAYTDKSITFHRSAIRNHWLYVAFILTVSVIKDPRLIGPLLTAIKVMSSRREEVTLGEDPLAEVIAIGVLPEYHTPKFITQTGHKISEELIEYVASFFRNAGLEKMRMIVDADNKPVLMFYHGLGARFEPYEQAGKKSVHVWFDLKNLCGDNKAGGFRLYETH